MVFGTTGEANSFSLEERIAFLEAILDAGLPRDRMLVGTGCCALSDTVRLTRHALSLGITGVLALPPFYYKNLSDEALFGSFDQVIQRVGDTSFALYLYHFPSLSGVPITPGLLERLGAAYPDSRRRERQLGRLEQHPDADRALSGARDLSGARPCSCPRCRRAAPAASAHRATSIPARSASFTMTSRPAPTVSSGAGPAQRRPQGPAAAADDPGDEAPYRRRAGRSRVAARGSAVPVLPDAEASALEMELNALGWRIGQT